MKTILFAMALMMAGVGASKAPESPKKSVEKAIRAFVEAGDQQNVDSFESLLHEHFRVVWNNPAEGKISVLDRATYLNLIGEKKFGGDTRTLSILDLKVIDECNATAEVELKGNAADMSSFYSLIKVNGEWKVLQDLVTVEFKQP